MTTKLRALSACSQGHACPHGSCCCSCCKYTGFVAIFCSWRCTLYRKRRLTITVMKRVSSRTGSTKNSVSFIEVDVVLEMLTPHWRQRTLQLREPRICLLSCHSNSVGKSRREDAAVCLPHDANTDRTTQDTTPLSSGSTLICALSGVSNRTQ